MTISVRIPAAVIALSLSLAALPAMAGDLVVKVTDAAGKPVRDAVVAFTPSGGASIGEDTRKGPFVMAQKNIHFSRFVLAVPMGATVSFPNQDRVNHHVFSFSPAGPFQLPLYGPGQTRSVKFDKEGTVALGCNIHDSMTAYIRVVATPYFATTGDDGKVTIDVPAGAGKIVVWQPLMDAPNHETDRAVTSSGGEQDFSVKVHAMAPMAGMY